MTDLAFELGAAGLALLFVLAGVWALRRLPDADEGDDL